MRRLPCIFLIVTGSLPVATNQHQSSVCRALVVSAALSVSTVPYKLSHEASIPCRIAAPEARRPIAGSVRKRNSGTGTLPQH